MARPPQDTIDTFVSISGATEAVALRKLEETKPKVTVQSKKVPTTGTKKESSDSSESDSTSDEETKLPKKGSKNGIALASKKESSDSSESDSSSDEEPVENPYPNKENI